MARFKIISKSDDSIVRYEGKPRYIGTYLKPSHLEFNEIASPTPIAWEVGDYVDYPRTGMRYRLYSIPQASKNANKGTYGGAFTYTGVQFHAATKELEIALFRDIVSNDNNIHFSTSPDVATFEDVYGIARRIQECMDEFYPNRWEIRVADFDDAEISDKIATKKDFALSGGTCLDALSKIYELWQDIGWIHTYDADADKEIITIGYGNALRGDNVSEEFLYGKGKGLTAIKKNQINKDEFATRLYVYGSERNLPPRYYTGFPNAESADIRNLMLPISEWGMTDGAPDPRKAYLQNDEAVAKYGVIPKVHYFDSEDAGADIYPTVERLTIGEIRNAMSSSDRYYPSSVYSDYDRADAVLYAENPVDDGVLHRDGKQYEEVLKKSIESFSPTLTIPKNSTQTVNAKGLLFDVTFDYSGMGEVSIVPGMNILVQGTKISSITATFELSDNITKQKEISVVSSIEAKQISDNMWSVAIPKMVLKYNEKDYDVFNAYLEVDLAITPESSSERNAIVIPPSNPLQINFARLLPATFTMRLRQIGFDIEERAAQGKGKKISMKSGMCEGRDFVISSCRYDIEEDSWVLTCNRQKDETLGVMFPNLDYSIQPEDEFVLIDIAMPDLYVEVAMGRLLQEGERLLARASRGLYNYEPSIDAKVMIDSGRTLREGMYMEITDEDIIDDNTDFILIDTLNIYEDEGAIPTYKVTLRERRKVTYKGTPSATTSANTSSVEEGVNESNDLARRLSALEILKDMFYWHDEAKTIIATNYGLISKQDMASNGKAQGGGGSGGNAIIITNWYEYDPSLSQALGAGLGVELNKRLSDIEDIDFSEYATFSDVNKAIADLINGAPAALDTLYEIAQVLEGNVDSINDILVAIGTKAEQKDLEALENRVSGLEEGNDMFSWLDEEHTTIITDKNLIVGGDISDGGVGEAVVGVTVIRINDDDYYDERGDGIIDISAAFSNLDVDIDLSDYYTKGEVNAIANNIRAEIESNDMFSWYDDEHTTIVTEKNLIVNGDISDVGVSEAIVGVTAITIGDNVYYGEDGVIDLSEALGSLDVDMSGYYTSDEVDGILNQYQPISTAINTDNIGEQTVARAGVSEIAGVAYGLVNDYDSPVLTILGGADDGYDTFYFLGHILPEYNDAFFIGSDEYFYKCTSTNRIFAGSDNNNLWLLAGNKSGNKIIFGNALSCYTVIKDREKFAELGELGLEVYGSVFIPDGSLWIGDNEFCSLDEAVELRGSLVVTGDVSSLGDSGGGTIVPDLEGYATEAWVGENFCTISDVDTMFENFANNYYTDGDVDAMLEQYLPIDGGSVNKLHVDDFSASSFSIQAIYNVDFIGAWNGRLDIDGWVVIDGGLDVRALYVYGGGIYFDDDNTNMIEVDSDGFHFSSKATFYDRISVWADGEEMVWVNPDGIGTTGEVAAFAGRFDELVVGGYTEILGDLYVDGEISGTTIDDIVERIETIERRIGL